MEIIFSKKEITWILHTIPFLKIPDKTTCRYFILFFNQLFDHTKSSLNEMIYIFLYRNNHLDLYSMWQKNRVHEMYFGALKSMFFMNIKRYDIHLYNEYLEMMACKNS